MYLSVYINCQHLHLVPIPHSLLLKMASCGVLSQCWQRGPTLRQEVCISSQGGELTPVTLRSQTLGFRQAGSSSQNCESALMDDSPPNDRYQAVNCG